MLKVAISGAHGVGKTTIVRELATRAEVDGWQVEVVATPTRHLKQLFGLENNKDSVGWLEFMNLTLKRVLAAEAAARLQQYEDEHSGFPQPPKTLLLSDRCLIDVAGYLGYQADHPPVADLPSFQAHRILSRLEMLDELAKEFAYLDAEWWDHIYFKPLHPGFLTADADRLDDRAWQADIDARIRHNWERARQRGARTSVLDVDREKAAEQIWDTISNSEKITRIFGTS